MRATLYILLFFDFLLLLAVSTQLSVSYYEAEFFFDNTHVLSYIIGFFTDIFSQSDMVARFPIILFHLASSWLIYEISKSYLLKESDRILALAIYLLLPGVNGAALLLNEVGLTIFLLLFFLYMHERNKIVSYLLLALYLPVDNAFVLLYLALFFYALSRKNIKFSAYVLLLFTLSMYLQGLSIGGHPRGHFLDTLGVYSAIFSPLLFLYFFYVIYKGLLGKQKGVLWYISSTAFLFSLLLSFRQRVEFEIFAPYAVIAIPLVMQHFFHSLRVRLPEFRARYTSGAIAVLIVLLLSVTTIFLNRALYAIVDNPASHFAYKHHVAKELASKLKEEKIFGVVTENKRLQQRLKFYNISNDYNTQLSTDRSEKSDKLVTVSYMNRTVATYYVTKLNR